MAAPHSSGRFLRIEDADTTPQPVAHRNKVTPSKPCVVPGCAGTMVFHKRLDVDDVPDAPHTLEWPWRASWQCTEDSTHVQLLSSGEEREIVRSLHSKNPE